MRTFLMDNKTSHSNIDGFSYSLHCMPNEAFLSSVCPTEVDLFFFSPPYNISSKSPKVVGRRKLGGYDAKSFRGITDYQDSIPEEEYQAQQIERVNSCLSLLKPGGVLVYNHKNRYKNNRIINPHTWLDKTNSDQMQEIVWNRLSTHENGRTHPHPIHEMLYVLTRKGDVGFYAPKFDKSLTNPSTVWSISKQTDNLHNAAFPLELAQRVVSLYSPKGGLVSDIYSGSGTTMLACRLLGRSFIGCELLQENFDISINRFIENPLNSNKTPANSKREQVGV